MEREPCPVCGMRLGVMVPSGSLAYAWCRSKQLGALPEGAPLVKNF